jgi:hypothetical protein
MALRLDHDAVCLQVISGYWMTSSDPPCDRKVQEGQFSVFSKVLSLLLRTL